MERVFPDFFSSASVVFAAFVEIPIEQIPIEQATGKHTAA